MSTFKNLFFFWIIQLDGYTFYHILEVSYCVIQILMQTVRPRAVLWSVSLYVRHVCGCYTIKDHKRRGQ